MHILFSFSFCSYWLQVHCMVMDTIQYGIVCYSLSLSLPRPAYPMFGVNVRVNCFWISSRISIACYCHSVALKLIAMHMRLCTQHMMCVEWGRILKRHTHSLSLSPWIYCSSLIWMWLHWKKEEEKFKEMVHITVHWHQSTTIIYHPLE